MIQRKRRRALYLANTEPCYYEMNKVILNPIKKGDSKQDFYGLLLLEFG